MNTWYCQLDPALPRYCLETAVAEGLGCPVLGSQQWHDDYKLFRTVFVYLLTGLEHYQNQKYVKRPGR